MCEFCIYLIFVSVDKAMSQLPHILPDYMLVFAVPVLAHDPSFERWDDVVELTKARQCLWFIMEPLITKNDSYHFGFYRNLIEKMKNHKDAIEGNDDSVNYKLWAICDLAMSLILSKTTNYDFKDNPSEVRIPTMYFSPQPDHFVNTKVFLPPELQYQAPKKTGITLAMVNTEKSVKRPKGKVKPEACGPLGTDVKVSHLPKSSQNNNSYT